MVTVAAGLLVLIAVAAIAWRLYEWQYQRRVEARLGRLRAAGKPTSIEEVHARREPLPPDENSALILLKALEQMRGVAAPYAGPTIEKLVAHVELGRRWSPGLRKVVARYLGPYGAMIETVRHAARLEQGAYRPEDPLSPPRGRLSAMAELFHLGQICWLASAARSEAAAPPVAKEGVEVCARLAASVGDDPFLRPVLTRRRLDATFVNALVRLLAFAELRPQEVEELRAEVQRELDVIDLGAALAAERVLWHEKLALRPAPSPPGPGWSPWWERLAQRGGRRLAPWRQRDLLAWHDALDRIEPLADLAPRERLLRLKHLEAQVAAGTPAEGGASAAVSALLSDLQRELYEWTRLRVADAALAVELYRLREGRWPDSLEDLAPDLLAEVPRDPFSDGHLRYRRRAWGAVVYSVGPDGRDEGGTHRHDANKAAGPGSRVVTGFDIPFRLFHRQRRSAQPADFVDEILHAAVTRRELEMAGLDREELTRLGLTAADLARLGFDGAREGAVRPNP